MSEPAITIEFSEKSNAAITQMRSMPERVLKAVARGLDAANELTIADITAKRLTGKGPFPVDEGRLGVVTNRMRGSLRRVKARIDGNSVLGGIGTNVRYAGVHEFGFNGQVYVESFVRHVKSRDTFAKVSHVSPKNARSYMRSVRTSAGIAIVKPFTRWMQMPARAPIGHGIADNVETYSEEIQKALMEAKPQ